MLRAYWNLPEVKNFPTGSRTVVPFSRAESQRDERRGKLCSREVHGKGRTLTPVECLYEKGVDD